MSAQTSNIISVAFARQAADRLAIGQLVAYSDRANPRQMAAVIDGGNEYGQWCVFEDGHRSQVRKSYCDGSCGWELVDHILTHELLANWLVRAEAHKISAERQAQIEKVENAKKHAEETARLLAEYPKLEKAAGSMKRGYALAAANIRRLLKAEFPLCSFSVTSKSFSMGNSVDVHWTDGPTTAEVEKISDRFQTGSFDGMTDCYNYETSAFTDLFGGSKYVHTSRTVSEARMREVADEMGYADKPLKWGEIEGVDHGTNTAFRNRYHGRSYYGVAESKPATAVAMPLHAPCLCW